MLDIQPTYLTGHIFLNYETQTDYLQACRPSCII